MHGISGRETQAKQAVSVCTREVVAPDERIDGLLPRIVGAASAAAIEPCDAKIFDFQKQWARLRESADARRGGEIGDPEGSMENLIERALGFANPWSLGEDGTATLRRTVFKLASAARPTHC